MGMFWPLTSKEIDSGWTCWAKYKPCKVSRVYKVSKDLKVHKESRGNKAFRAEKVILVA
jgi:hypothetical protein